MTDFLDLSNHYAIGKAILQLIVRVDEIVSFPSKLIKTN